MKSHANKPENLQNDHEQPFVLWQYKNIPR